MPKISRRDWVLGGAAFLGASACGPTKGTGYPGYALIATAGQASVAAVDLTAFRLAKSIPVAGEPDSVTATPDGGAFALLGNAGTIASISPDLTVNRQRKIAGRLSALRLMPGGKQLVTVNPDSDEVLLVDANTLQIRWRRRLHETPGHVDVTRDGAWIVTASGNGAVNLMNPQTGEWRHTQLKGPAGAVLFRFDSKMILVGSPAERILTGLRTPDLAIVAELPLAMEPENLCFTPDGGQLFVSGPGMDGVAIVFPYNTLRVEQTVLVGPDPGAMACSDSPLYLFVGNASGTDVSIMSVDNRKDVGAVDVGSRPTYLALTPDGQYALALCEESGDVAVIRVGAIKANRSKTGVALFTMLPVGEKPVHCAFVPRPLG